MSDTDALPIVVKLAVSVLAGGFLAGCVMGSPAYPTEYKPIIEMHVRGVAVTCWPTYREIKAGISLWVHNRSQDTLYVDLKPFRAHSSTRSEREWQFRPYSTSGSVEHCLSFSGPSDEVRLCGGFSRSWAGVNERFDLDLDMDTLAKADSPDSVQVARFFPIAPGMRRRVSHQMGFRYGDVVPHHVRSADLLDRDECTERFGIQQDTLLVTTPPVLQNGETVIPSREMRFTHPEDE